MRSWQQYEEQTLLHYHPLDNCFNHPLHTRNWGDQFLVKMQGEKKKAPEKAGVMSSSCARKVHAVKSAVRRSLPVQFSSFSAPSRPQNKDKTEHSARLSLFICFQVKFVHKNQRQDSPLNDRRPIIITSPIPNWLVDAFVSILISYGMVHFHTSGRYNKRWVLTKSERYKNRDGTWI